jgi:hypothetical protein
VIVRVSSQSSFCDARRFNSYLEKSIEKILSSKGFEGEYSCDARLQKSAGGIKNFSEVFSFRLMLHGSQSLGEVVSCQGQRIGLAIRQGLKMLEARLSRRHDRKTHAAKHRVKVARLLANELV